MQYRFVLTECADSHRAKFTSEVGEPLEQVYRNKPIVIFTIKKTYCFITLPDLGPAMIQKVLVRIE